MTEEQFFTPEKKAFWKNRHVFVTGGFGLLGSHIAEFVTRLGAKVVVLKRDHVPSSRLFETDAFKKMAVVKGDFEDYNLVYRVLNEYEIDTVFHVGAQPIVSVARRAPLATLKTNVMGTANVLEASRLSPTVSRVLVASSDKAYGDQPVLPYKEDAPLEGRYPYDCSKSCTDLISQMYHRTYQLPVCVTRCGNLYGPGDLNFNRLIPETIKHVIHNEEPLIRSDGQFIRDYFFVKDAALGYIAIAEHMDNAEIHGHAFNLSTGNGIKAIDVVHRILDVMKTDLKPVILNEAKAEIIEQTLSSEKALEILGWKPHYTVEQGLADTIDWYKAYFEKHAEEAVQPAPAYDNVLS